MALYVPQVGLIRMLNEIIADTLTLRLFSNNLTPSALNTSTSFTEVTSGGYAAILLAAVNWTVTAGNPSYAVYNAFQNFAFTGVIGGSGSVYGYYITRASGEVVIAQRFPAGVVPVTPTNGSFIAIKPRITLDNA